MKFFKRRVNFVPAFLAAAIMLIPFAQGVFAEDTDGGYGGNGEKCLESGDWLYYDRGDHLCVCGYDGLDERAVIPSEIDGKEVWEISCRRHLGWKDEMKWRFISPRNKSTREIIIPEGVRAIESRAFYGCQAESIILPKSLKTIEYEAFYRSGILGIEIPEGVKVIGSGAFSDSAVEEVWLHEGLAAIYGRAFEGTWIKRISLPSTVTEIGYGAFAGSKLEEIILPKDLLRVEMYMFRDCRRLKRVCISEGTMVLEEGIFYSCEELESVYFPSTISSSERIFQNNESLKALSFAGDERDCLMAFGRDMTDTLFEYDRTWKEEEREARSLFESLTLTYNSPVPISIPALLPSCLPAKGEELEGISLFFAITALTGFVGTAVFTVLSIKAGRRAARKKISSAAEDGSGFRPEVLGLWHCKGCGAANGSIANYCCRCGRKRE